MKKGDLDPLTFNTGKVIQEPVKPLDPKRPTLSEKWAVNGRVEPYGA
jgi:hypothetical protein